MQRSINFITWSGVLRMNKILNFLRMYQFRLIKVEHGIFYFYLQTQMKKTSTKIQNKSKQLKPQYSQRLRRESTAASNNVRIRVSQS